MARVWAALAVLAGLAACAPLPPPASVSDDGRVRVVGYNDMDEMLTALAQGFARHHPGVRFDFQLEGTRTAPQALLEGRSAFAPMGAELEAEDVARLRERFGYAPIEVRVAHDSFDPRALSSPTGLFVHRDNPLRAMTLEQAALALGAKSGAAPLTWGALGGQGEWSDKPVHLIGLESDTAIAGRTARVLGMELGWDPTMRGFRQSRDAAAAAAADPLALTVANLNHARPELRALSLIVNGEKRDPDPATVASGRYPLDRHLLIYVPTRRDGSPARFAARFVRYALSDAGQAIIAAGSRGYLPLSPEERESERKKVR